MTTKKCSKCGKVKPLDKFYKDKKGKNGLASHCKSCDLLKQMKKRYGITIDQYEMMLKRQHYGCKICGQQCPTGKRLAVDHCHHTGMICGLLCSSCNTALGSFNDDVNRLNLAAQYLTCSGEWLSGSLR